MPVRRAASEQPAEVLPFKVVAVGVLLTPDDFDIPHVRCFTARELAHYLMADTRQIVGLIEEGTLRALPFGRGRFKIPYIEVVHFFLRAQGAMN